MEETADTQMRPYLVHRLGTRPINLLIVMSYVVLITAYPLFGSEEINPGLFYAGWLGSSYAAGILVPQRWMLMVPSVVFLVLLAIMATGMSDSELLADPLSSVALLVLAAGQTGGIRLGLATISYRRRRVDHQGG